MKQTARITLAAVLTLCVGFAAAQDKAAPKDSPLKTGKPAPDFTFKTLDGAGDITLSNYKDKQPVALIFAKPGAEGLAQYASAIEEIHQKHKTRVAFFLVYLKPEASAKQELLRKTRDELKLSMEVLHDPAEDSDWYEGLFVIDETGKLTWKSKEGAFKTEDWKREIEKILKAIDRREQAKKNTRSQSQPQQPQQQPQPGGGGGGGGGGGAGMPPPGWRPPKPNAGGGQQQPAAGGGGGGNQQQQPQNPPPAAGGGGGGNNNNGGGGNPPAPPPAQSNGSGGPAANGSQKTSGGTPFELVLPSGFKATTAYGVLIVFSGVEGAQTMAQNIAQSGGMPGHITAVLDGRSARAADGSDVLNQLRAWYNVDNNAIKVLTESAGTREGLTFALRLAQGEIAAVWANDPVAVVTPSADAKSLGFKPWGSAGAGGKASRDVQNAQSIVDGMAQKGYNTRPPFIDPNSGHGTIKGFLEGLKFLSDKFKGK